MGNIDTYQRRMISVPIMAIKQDKAGFKDIGVICFSKLSNDELTRFHQVSVLKMLYWMLPVYLNLYVERQRNSFIETAFSKFTKTSIVL